MKITSRFFLFLLATGLAACGEDPLAISKEAHREQVLDWQLQREASLTRENGWLSLVGLCWLERGANDFGRADSSDCMVPYSKMPDTLGSFLVEDDGIRFIPREDYTVTHEGEEVTAIDMRSDHQENTTLLAHETLRFYVIERFGEVGVRVRDLESPALQDFEGLDYFPVDIDWRKISRFEPYAEPRDIPIINILGMRDGMRSPGELVFEHGGEEYRLIALADEGDDRWFVMIADGTSGRTTYGAGRYIYVDPPVDGRTVLDLNTVYNPPCAFTALATCPLPPMRNRLDLDITAGEKTYHSEDAWQADGA
ncbi:MAG: DUF1684 domain-containing protein [Gammaproteobacteria bacterium]|nr:DUF1684 domain-containing protein [Gammaproteobacteria bacterium]